jgi:ribose/xylose/arabinose/galactoside ABC-type transport system permease subunit
LRERFRRFTAVREFSTGAILVLEILFFTWWLWPDGNRSHPFLNGPNGLLILKYSAIYGIAAVGAASVIISGGIDLAPGAVMALAGVVGAQLFIVQGWGLGPAMSVAVLVGLVSGLLTAALVVLVKLPPFIATLGVMGITRGLAFIITEGQYFDVSGHLAGGWRPLGLPADWVAPIIMIALALVFQFFMTTFQWGRAVFSVGGNETAALFSGIAVGRIKTSVYVISGVLAAVSGVVLALVQGQAKADLATGYELDIIASSVVGGASLAGGKGSAVNAMLGALLIVLIRQSIRTLHFDQNYEWIIIGCAIIVAVVLDRASASFTARHLSQTATRHS